MKNRFWYSILLFVLLPMHLHAYRVSFDIYPRDIAAGYVTKQLPLARYGMPRIKLDSSAYIDNGKSGCADTIDGITVKIGTERKMAFAVISMPAFRRLADGRCQRVSFARFEVLEADSSGVGGATTALAKGTGGSNPLAAGTWYKIAVPSRGVYRIDGQFLQRLGIPLSGLRPSEIRLFGNGGAMLSEDNAVFRPMGLVENSIWVNDGGDGRFDAGDFLAFYSPGPTRWDKDSTNRRFLHVSNLYADSSYYFLSVDAGAGKRIGQVSAAPASTVSVVEFDDYAVHEQDLFNPGYFGKEWWGEKFGNGSIAPSSRDFSFNLGSMTDTLGLRISVASRASDPLSRMDISLNGVQLASHTFPPVSFEEGRPPVAVGNTDAKTALNASSAIVSIAYAGDMQSTGYLNFIELNWRRKLAFSGGNFMFRDWRSVKPGAVANYLIDGASASTQVWDITDPQLPERMNGSLVGSRYSFSRDAGRLREFVALDGSSFAVPVGLGRIDNQDLHGADAPELVIVTHPDFAAAAQRLAASHREKDGLRVLVATTNQVYNEFSSGGQDLAAIRDMMRYYYLLAGSDSSRMPRYLLLFGDASYDYKSRIASNTNFVPTFQSADGVDIDNSFTADDFFGFLDDRENMSDFGIVNTLDIGIGRIPVGSKEQAESAVDKVLAYRSPAAMGPWRLSNTYIADNEDNAGFHPGDAEDAAAAVNGRTALANDSKIYLDSYPFVSTPSGERCPDANKAISDRIFNGTFLINYTGHGSIVTLAHERILTKDDFTRWKNINKLPFMVTATCDYARFDNPAYVSSGEAMVLKEDGGTIAMLTTTGLVYAGINRAINQQFLAEQYTRTGDRWPAFGDAIRQGKNTTFKRSPSGFELINFYRFTLLGDPALRPAFPEYEIRTDSVVDLFTGSKTDTISALGRYQLYARITDRSGRTLDWFNGRGYVSVFDKARSINIKTKVFQLDLKYQIRDNIVFKGIGSVERGTLSCSFIAPKDMDYDYGLGRISLYAENGQFDAAGTDTTIIAGGYVEDAPIDEEGPLVKAYIGDTLFRDGGVTGSNSLLYVTLFDSSGINVSGSSVGHDLTAILDGELSQPYNLNDYYQTDPNTFQKGTVSFPLAGLADGLHRLDIKAWDVYNNSGTGSVRFVVGNAWLMVLDRIGNYPNPFASSTRFVVNHNHPGEKIGIEVHIYDMSGRKVRSIQETLQAGDGGRSELDWDGTADSGSELPSGVYPYRVLVKSQEGIEALGTQKLVIIR